MKTELKMFRKLTVILALAMIMFIAAILGLSTQYASATSDSETNYTFETVPVESIEITVDGGLREIQPRQEFTVSYEITPWYTTTSEIYFDVMPRNAAVVSEVSKVSLIDGIAQGTARIAVSPNATVGSTFTVFAGVDGIESNTIEMTVEKIPVKDISLSAQGTDDKLHIGKTRTVQCEFFPSYASVQDVRYELSGSGMKYIENFDETSGTITARRDVAYIDVNSTVTITAYSVDNPNAFDSVTLTLYMPTTIVEISAATPLGRFNSDGNALAVASSIAGDTVSLSATVNGVDSTGLNYIIVKGQEYVENGYVRSDGTFELRPTSNWSESMKIPHAEVKIRAAYSDGFDEITVSVYVPVERISFINPVVSNVENFRSYDMQVEAFPKYATLLADNAEPIYYSLNGIDGAIATVDGNGLLNLPKSLTSKGSIINYSANLTNEWVGVDVQPLTKDLTVVPVYAESFNSIKITKNGLAIDDRDVKALPSDNLQLDIVYNVDNVTDIDVVLSQDSDIISTVGSSIAVFALNAMHEDNPFIEITVNYNHGGNVFAEKCYLSIYVPALSAEIADVAFHRDRELNLNENIMINGHGYASNKTIEWGTPTVINGKDGITATCGNGMLRIESNANAGTNVRIPYKTFDSDTWQYKELSVAALDGDFTLVYGEIWSGKDNRKYKVDDNAPQLEEGQSVDLKLNYEGFGGRTRYGLTYSVEVSSSNATLVFKSYEESEDVFTLSAKSGQSGQNNYITYKITVYDGDATYYVYTDGMSVPDSIVNGLVSKKIAIFKRISGTLGVSDDYMEVYYSFTLTGWDSSFTFNQNDLKWELSNGGTMNGNIFAASPDCGFVLSITAEQKYNDSQIRYSSEISFCAIIYKAEDSDSSIQTKSRVFKKTEYNLTLKGEICFKSEFVHTGWSNENKGSKDYYLGDTYSGCQDKTLYAYWDRYAVTIHIGVDGDVDGNTGGEEKTLDENQNKDFHTREYYVGLEISKLRELGYTKISVKIQSLLERTVHDGNYAKLWLDVDGSCVYTKDRFQPTSSYSWSNSTYTKIDITQFSENSKIRLGFYTYDDGIAGKFTWKFYESKVTLTAIK